MPELTQEEYHLLQLQKQFEVMKAELRIYKRQKAEALEVENARHNEAIDNINNTYDPLIVSKEQEIDATVEQNDSLLTS